MKAVKLVLLEREPLVIEKQNKEEIKARVWTGPAMPPSAPLSWSGVPRRVLPSFVNDLTIFNFFQ